jgi:hypothetical protein
MTVAWRPVHKRSESHPHVPLFLSGYPPARTPTEGRQRVRFFCERLWRGRLEKIGNLANPYRTRDSRVSKRGQSAPTPIPFPARALWWRARLHDTARKLGVSKTTGYRAVRWSPIPRSGQTPERIATNLFPGGLCHRPRLDASNPRPNQPTGSPSQHGNHPIRATRKRAPVGGVHVRSGVGFMWEPRKSYPGRPSPGADRPDPLSTTPQSRLPVFSSLLLGASCLLPRR